MRETRLRIWSTLAVSTLAGVAFLLAPAAAEAQMEDLPTSLSYEYTIAQEHVHDTYVSVSLKGRLSFLDGEVDPFIPVDYSDIFDAGTGVALQADLMVDNHSWWLGGYLSVAWDGYDGDISVDAFGDSLEPDSMDILTVTGGFKAMFPFAEHWYTDMYAGLGIANYDGVDGVLTIGGTPSQVKVFSSTTVFAFELGGHIGLVVDSFFADFGLGFRVQGHPDDADISLDSAAAGIFFLELGAGFRF